MFESVTQNQEKPELASVHEIRHSKIQVPIVALD
jgi:hypothetical protein